MSQPPGTHVSTCPLCEAMCGVLVEVDGRRIRAGRGDPDDPLSRGYICPKAAALVDLHHDPDRIRAPLIRAGRTWRETTWEEALEHAAAGLARVRRLHGRDGVAVYYGNPVAHNLGLMTHLLPFTRALRTRNVYSASSADQLPQMLAALRMFGHFALIPVPDVDRTDFFLGRLAGRVKGLDTLAGLVGGLPPERVAGRTGIPAPAIRRLATGFATAKRAAGYGRVGLCTQRHGTLGVWLLQALNLVTGRFDEEGGLLLTTPAVDGAGVLARLGFRGTFDRWRGGRLRLPEFTGELPVAALADEIESNRNGAVRALITVAGNPVLSAPNGRRLDRALGGLEHVVAIDPYLNETTRHAHVLLPPAPPLARPHYDLALNAFAVRNVARYAAPVLPPAPGERHDWEILTELAGRLCAPRPLRRAAVRALAQLTPDRILDVLLRLGPHRLSLPALRAAPHGVDLGPLQPGRIAGLVATPVDLAPEDFVREARTRLRAEAARPTNDDLR